MMDWVVRLRPNSGEWIDKAEVVGNSFHSPIQILIIANARIPVCKEADHGLRGSGSCESRLWNIAWHLNVPLLRELAERTRASGSDQDQIPVLSQINGIISTFVFLNLKLSLNETEENS